MWHFADLRFADPMIFLYANLKLPQIRKYIPFPLTNLTYSDLYIKKSFEKTTFRAVLRIKTVKICRFAICVLAHVRKEAKNLRNWDLRTKKKFACPPLVVSGLYFSEKLAGKSQKCLRWSQHDGG